MSKTQPLIWLVHSRDEPHALMDKNLHGSGKQYAQSDIIGSRAPSDRDYFPYKGREFTHGVYGKEFYHSFKRKKEIRETPRTRKHDQAKPSAAESVHTSRSKVFVSIQEAQKLQMTTDSSSFFRPGVHRLVNLCFSPRQALPPGALSISHLERMRNYFMHRCHARL